MGQYSPLSFKENSGTHGFEILTEALIGKTSIVQILFFLSVSMELSQGTIDIIKATAPVVEQHGLAITKRFYENLFENHPYVNNFFNKSHVFPENGQISPQVSLLRFSCLLVTVPT